MEPYRVFVPKRILDVSTLVCTCGLLVGHQSDSRTLFISAVIPSMDLDASWNFIKDLKIIGILIFECDFRVVNDVLEAQLKSSSSSSSLAIHLTINGSSVISVESLFKSGFKIDNANRLCDIFLFEPEEFSSTQIPILDDERLSMDRNPLQVMIYILRLKKLMNDSSLVLSTSTINFFANDRRVIKKSLVIQYLRVLGYILYMSLNFFAIFLKAIFRRSGLSSVASLASPYVNLINQAHIRLQNIDMLIDCNFNGTNSLMKLNIVFGVAIDLLMGMLVSWVLGNYLSTEALFDIFMTTAEFVVGQLQDLLQWMQGSPAGLKLNLPLNYSLGTFFLFHIYLWQEYLGMIEPALRVILQAAFYTGLFGLSFQLSLLQDLLGLLTFHVYCFYAYAAKLYSLHMIGIVSFWRVFRGKKWNPLRERVDSCSYDTDQLFMGTLTLTVLVFLIPTTALYYLVFTMLRLTALVAQGFLHKVTSFINLAPIYVCLLYFVKSKQLTSDITVRVEPSYKSSDKQSLVVTIKGTVGSWEKVTSLFLSNPVEQQTTVKNLSWSDFIVNLITGKLIYPI